MSKKNLISVGKITSRIFFLQKHLLFNSGVFYHVFAERIPVRNFGGRGRPIHNPNFVNGRFWQGQSLQEIFFIKITYLINSGAFYNVFAERIPVRNVLEIFVNGAAIHPFQGSKYRSKSDCKAKRKRFFFAKNCEAKRKCFLFVRSEHFLKIAKNCEKMRNCEKIFKLVKCLLVSFFYFFLVYKCYISDVTSLYRFFVTLS